MSQMFDYTDLEYDIEQLYIEGMSAKRIAKELNCPVAIVESWIKNNNVGFSQQEDFDPFSTVNS